MGCELSEIHGGSASEPRPEDSLVVSVSFKDGDGDLGLNSEEIQNPPYTDGNNNLNYLVETFCLFYFSLQIHGNESKCKPVR